MEQISIATLVLVIISLVLIVIFSAFFSYIHIRSLHKNKVKASFNDLGITTQKKIIYELFYAARFLSKNKIGALITIQQSDLLDDFRTDGVTIDAKITASLLIAIFQKNSPLHDGAVVIVDDRILYASTYFSVSDSNLSDRYGARHRAALGIAEQSDSVTIVISEQTGEIIIAHKGNFLKVTNLEMFGDILEKEINS
ncbi:diadenylate cyclase [Mesomycoplasma conjunctivae]|uniref:diadenylate cyclase n=1 Tax=Mesomycoplasma conjunctivae TaxID=45361 RepID=UPI003DA63290